MIGNPEQHKVRLDVLLVNWVQNIGCYRLLEQRKRLALLEDWAKANCGLFSIVLTLPIRRVTQQWTQKGVHFLAERLPRESFQNARSAQLSSRKSMAPTHLSCVPTENLGYR